MSRPQTVETLEAKKADLLAQVKQIDAAIRVAKEREQQKKQKAILDAMAARGLLDKDLDAVLAAIAKAAPTAPAANPSAVQTGEPTDTE